MRVDIHTYIYTHTHVHTHTHTHTHTHVHTYTHVRCTRSAKRSTTPMYVHSKELYVHAGQPYVPLHKSPASTSREHCVCMSECVCLCVYVCVCMSVGVWQVACHSKIEGKGGRGGRHNAGDCKERECVCVCLYERESEGENPVVWF